MDPQILIKEAINGLILYFCDIRGPPTPSPLSPWGCVDHRLRTYAIWQSQFNKIINPCTINSFSIKTSCNNLSLIMLFSNTIFFHWLFISEILFRLFQRPSQQRQQRHPINRIRIRTENGPAETWSWLPFRSVDPLTEVDGNGFSWPGNNPLKRYYIRRVEIFIISLTAL